jgi:hypothetical protein
MRMMLKVCIPVETGNAAARKGELGATIQKIVAEMKPEAVYFLEQDGKRTGLIFFHMNDTSEIPAIAEPWFLAFNATVTFRPVMNGEDLAKAAPGIERAVEAYSKAAGA